MHTWNYNLGIRNTARQTFTTKSEAGHNKHSFYPVHTYKMLKEKSVLMVLWNGISSDLTKNCLSIRVWRRLLNELTSTAKWHPRADVPTLCLITQGLQLTHKDARVRIWIYPTLLDKSNHSHTCRLTPYFLRQFALFGDSINAQSRQSKPVSMIDAPTVHVTLSKELPKIVPYHLVFDEDYVTRIYRPCWLYQGQILAIFCMK